MSEESSISPSAAYADNQGSQAPIPRKEIEVELEAVLQSAEFRGSKRCQEFLRFVVDETLNGLPNGLKERTIGIGVFGREAAYDTNEDGTVRIKASEVRKRLTLYYAGTGKDSAMRIELPIGSYVPTFSRIRAAAAESEPMLPTEVGPSKTSEAPPQGRRLPIVTAAILATAILSVAAWLWVNHRASALEQFWGPVLQSPAP